MLRFTKLIAFGKEIELEESEERVPEYKAKRKKQNCAKIRFTILAISKCTIH